VKFFSEDKPDRFGGESLHAPHSPNHDAAPVDEDGLDRAVEDLLIREFGKGFGGDDMPAEQGGKTPQPLAIDRIIQWTSDSRYTYFVDSDGDVGGMWHGRLFYFLLFGMNKEILQVRGQWNRDLAIERLEEILDFCNEWTADRIWPKAYTRVRDNGMIQVFTEVTVDLEHGVNDDQLDQLLQCGLSTGSMFFDTLDERYPDPARQAP
jgi:hypothetical protein